MIFQTGNPNRNFLPAIRMFCLTFAAIFCGISCSVPNLEKPECTDSRAAVKQFYSKHFGGDFKPDFEKLKSNENLLSSGLFEELKNRPETEIDYFTQTADYPKAFRVGGCQVVSDGRTNVEVLLFWKTEERSEQRELTVATSLENGNWVIENVENKK